MHIWRFKNDDFNQHSAQSHMLGSSEYLTSVCPVPLRAVFLHNLRRGFQTNQACDLVTPFPCCAAAAEASRGRNVALSSSKQRSWTTAGSVWIHISGILCIFYDENMLLTGAHHCKSGLMLFSSSKESVMMQFCGNKLDKKDFFGKSDPFLVFYRSNEDGTWVSSFLSPSLRPSVSSFMFAVILWCIQGKLLSLICLRWKSQAACVDRV